MNRDPILILSIIAIVGASIATYIIVDAHDDLMHDLRRFEIFRMDWSGKR